MRRKVENEKSGDNGSKPQGNVHLVVWKNRINNVTLKKKKKPLGKPSIISQHTSGEFRHKQKKLRHKKAQAKNPLDKKEVRPAARKTPRGG